MTDTMAPLTTIQQSYSEVSKSFNSVGSNQELNNDFSEMTDTMAPLTTIQQSYNEGPKSFDSVGSNQELNNDFPEMTDTMMHNKRSMVRASPESKRVRLEHENPKTLKQQVLHLSKVQNYLLDILKKKNIIDSESFDELKLNIDNISPTKRNPRVIPGIYKDEDNRKYYISSNGCKIYKRPCGKSRKDSVWCFYSGEWVQEGAYTEQEANKMYNNTLQEAAPPYQNEVLDTDENRDELPPVISDEESDSDSDDDGK